MDEKNKDIIENEAQETNFNEEIKEEVVEEELDVTGETVKVKNKSKTSKARMKHGAFASIMTLAVIAVVIILNLVVGKLGIQFDMTEDDLFSLSDQSIKIVKALDKEVNIYAIYETGGENVQFMEMLETYTTYSNKVKLQTIDPNLNPQLVNKYVKDNENISTGSIIVESGDRFKVLTQYDILEYDINYSTYQYQVTGIALEPKVTAAIQYVTTDDLPIVYTLEGHEEYDISSLVGDYLDNDNYELKTLNLLTEQKVPEDASMLLITVPARDYSESETQILKDYLSKDGKAMFVLDLYTEKLPNFESILSAYGVKPQNLPVIEGSSNYCLQNNPLYIIPTLESNEITAPITESKMNMVVPMTQAIEILSEKSADTEITPLVKTSSSSYAKGDINATSVEKEAGDIDGPFNLAVLVEEEWYNDSTTYFTQIIVISTSNILDSYIDAYSSGANMDFFMNCVNYLSDRTDSISIRSKSLTTEYLNLNWTQAIILAGVSVIVIPGIILVAGLVIWLRRRHK